MPFPEGERPRAFLTLSLVRRQLPNGDIERHILHCGEMIICYKTLEPTKFYPAAEVTYELMNRTLEQASDLSIDAVCHMSIDQGSFFLMHPQTKVAHKRNEDGVISVFTSHESSSYAVLPLSSMDLFYDMMRKSPDCRDIFGGFFDNHNPLNN